MTMCPVLQIYQLLRDISPGVVTPNVWIIAFLIVLQFILFAVAVKLSFSASIRALLIMDIYSFASYVITMIVSYANIYKILGLLDDGLPVTKISDFLYFSIITWTTVGYGDIKPSVNSRIWAASEALLGSVTMGLLLAVVFYIISSRNRS